MPGTSSLDPAWAKPWTEPTDDDNSHAMASHGMARSIRIQVEERGTICPWSLLSLFPGVSGVSGDPEELLPIPPTP